MALENPRQCDVSAGVCFLLSGNYLNSRRASWPIREWYDVAIGAWVRTEKDEVGKVIHISRLTVFVALPNHPKPDRVEAFLESQLTKVAGQDRK